MGCSGHGPGALCLGGSAELAVGASDGFKFDLIAGVTGFYWCLRASGSGGVVKVLFL